MAFQPAPGVAKVDMVYTSGGQTVVNVFHVKTTEEWTSEFLENLIVLFYGWFGAELADLMSNAVTLTTIRARDLTTEFAAYTEFSPTTDNVGTRVSPLLPNNVTAAMKWTTGLTGRSTRGRTYHIGLTEDAATSQELVSAIRTQLISAYDSLITLVSAAEIAWSLVVLSRVQDGVPLANAIAYDILEVTTDTFLDSMRKRLAGRGI